MLRRVRKRVEQAIKFSSFGLHLSEPFCDIALEQYKMERGEQVHIYMSEIPGGLYHSWCLSPHGNHQVPSSSCACMYMDMHRCCARLLSKKPSVNILQLLKIYTRFWSLLFFTAFAIFHLKVSSFSKKFKLFWEKSMSIGVVCLIKSHRAWGQPAPSSFQLSGPGGKRPGASYEGWGTACGVGGFCEVSFGKGEIDFTMFENNLTPEGVVFDVGRGL